MGGLDTILRACNQIFKELNSDPMPSSLLVEKVKRGELGVKSGKGWHDYSGRSRTEIVKERDTKLVRQLVLFNELKQDKDEKTGP